MGEGERVIKQEREQNMAICKPKKIYPLFNGFFEIEEIMVYEYDFGSRHLLIQAAS